MTTCIITKKTKFDPKTKTTLFFSEMQKFKYWPDEDSNEDFLLSKDPPEKVSKKRQKKFGEEFESLVEKKLLDLGFKKMDLESVGLTKEDVTSRKEFIVDDLIEFDYPEILYIAHPLGTTNHPDFVIIERKRIFYIECKTNKSSYNPKWGTNYPQGDDIWLFCCGRLGKKKPKNILMNQTTFLLGKDYVPMKEYLKEVQKQRYEADKKLGDTVRETTGFINIDKRGLKFDDCSTIENGILFHPDREDRENRVLDLTNKP